MQIDPQQFQTDLSRVRHELHTPLNAIIGYSEMLLEEARAGKQDLFIRDLERIRAASERLLSMIGQLLQPAQFGVEQAQQTRTERPAADRPKRAAALEKPDLDRLSLPEDLYIRLKEAAEVHNITQVRKCLAEMESLGENGARLAGLLRQLSRQYNLEEIVAVLENMRGG